MGRRRRKRAAEEDPLGGGPALKRGHVAAGKEEEERSRRANRAELDQEKEVRGRVDLTKYRMIKRVAERPPAKKNDLYVSSKTNMQSSVRRVVSLLSNTEFPEVRIHASGMAIHRAVTLALTSQSSPGAPETELDIWTSSVDMIDDFEPLQEDVPPLTQRRTISSIHISIRRKFPLL